MWRGGTFHFEHRLVLLSEGVADRKFFEKLIQVRRLPSFDLPWPVLPEEEAPDDAKALYGVDRIGAMLEAMNGILHARPELKEQIRGVLIVVDAKDSANGTLQQLRRQIEKAGSFPLPNALGDVAYSNNGHPRIAVLLLPGGDAPGSLETLYVKAVAARYRSAAKCVEALLECPLMFETGTSKNKPSPAFNAW